MIDKLKGKTLLVTGGTGFIGGELIKRLESVPDTRLVVLAREPDRSIKRDGIWINTSLENLNCQTWKANGVESIDYVYHLGAFTPKKASEVDNVDPIYQANICGTKSLLESLPSTPEVFVFASTLDVYSQSKSEEKLNESSPIDAKGLYAASKFFGEKLVEVEGGRNGFQSVILRYGHIYGPGEAMYYKFIPVIIQRLLKKEVPIIYGDGSALRDFLYVGDAVEATLRASVANNLDGMPINIVRGKSISIASILEMLFEITKFEGEPIFKKNSGPNISFQFDNERMRRSLGEWELVSLGEGLRNEVKYFRGLMS
jgi:nucleoside-diphosphate-sugar epimerase